MNLDDAQKRTVAEWIARGQQLSEIQKRLADELGVHLTYMEVRFLVDDLKLMPKDAERSKPLELPDKQPASGPAAPLMGAKPGDEQTEISPEGELPPPGARHVSVKVDQLARPGSLVSGSVTFSDGNSATWYLDQFGRLGLAPNVEGYKPAAADLQVFQLELQSELAKLGF